MHKDWLLAAPSIFISRRQEELEARLVEEETTKRVEELVAKRVQEELERRKDEIEREVLRRVEEAKKVGGAKPEGGLSSLPGRPKRSALTGPSQQLPIAMAGWLASYQLAPGLLIYIMLYM